MSGANWVWGLLLIALTIAIHATGAVMMAVVGLRIRVWVETRKLRFREMIPIVIGGVGAVGLLLAPRPISRRAAAAKLNRHFKGRTVVWPVW